MSKTAVATSLFAAMLAGAAALAQQKMDDMKGMDMAKPPASSAKAHRAVGVVKGVNAAAGTVTFAHEPVKDLNWPAMTMDFNVKDRALFARLAQGKKVEFEFVEEGDNYVVTAVK